MRLSRRERVLLWLLFIVMAVGAYVVFYYRPAMARMEAIQASIDEKNAALDAAEVQVLRLAGVTRGLEDLTEPYYAMRERLSPYFDDAEVLRLFDNIVVRHSPKMKVTFSPPAEEEEAEGAPIRETQAHTVELVFSAPFNTMQGILLQLAANARLDNRVIRFSISHLEEPPEWAGEATGVDGFLEGALTEEELQLLPEEEQQLLAGEQSPAEAGAAAIDSAWYEATVSVEFIVLRNEAEIQEELASRNTLALLEAA